MSKAPRTAASGRKITVSSTTLDKMREPTGRKANAGRNIYVPYEPPPGVLPKGLSGNKLAMDSGYNCVNFGVNPWVGGNLNAVLDEGYAFPGFQLLSQWSQIIEFRRPCEVYAREMTRKWIKLIAAGEEDKTEKIKAIEAEFKRLNIREVFRKAIEHDALFGRAHIFLDMGEQEGDELKTPLVESNVKITKGSLKRLQVIEPIWFYPNFYNSTNPLNQTFYKPTSWFCMAQEIHSSRLCNIITRELPDILKPAYAFAGISLQQVMKPYIDNWLRTRQNISDLINAFTVWTLKTDMSTITMDDGGVSFFNRLQLFNTTRDNHGTNAIDKETEDFSNVSVPLGGLDQLQAQAQEHMCAPSGLPLVYLTGITPAGLNASSQDEIEVFQDTVSANQALFTQHVSKILNIVMLSLFGEIDPDIGFEWEPLKIVPEKDKVEIRKMEAELNIAYTDAGILAPDEVRKQIANEEDSPYSGLDLEREIDPPIDPADDPEMRDFHESIGGGNGNE
jgi:phage-related protein (TIGR01555 family)